MKQPTQITRRGSRRDFLRTLAAAAFGSTVLPTVLPVDPWDEGPYRCVMNRPYNETTLRSETITWRCNIPSGLLIIENFTE